MSQARCTICALRAPVSVFGQRKGTGALFCPRCKGPSVVAGQAMQFTGQDPNPSPYVTASFFGIVTPTDVRREKEDIQIYVTTINGSLGGCAPSTPPGYISGWKAFVATWNKFYTDKSNPASAGPDMERALGFRRDLVTWRNNLGTYCSNLPDVPGQSTVEVPVTPGSVGDITNKAAGAVKSWSTAVTVVAVVGGVVLLWVIYQNYKMSRELAPQLLSKVNTIPL